MAHQIRQAMSVRFDTTKLDRKMEALTFILPRTFKRIVRRTTAASIRVQKQRAPVGKSGKSQFTRAGKYSGATDAHGKVGGNLKSRITVIRMSGDGLRSESGSMVNYLGYVVNKTRASPGRYVPGLGKRLVNPARGMHPGTPENPFVNEAAEEVENDYMPRIVEEELTKDLAKFQGVV